MRIFSSPSRSTPEWIQGHPWSGCSGVGLECWASAFLAQNGLDPENWPEEFRKRVGKLPEDIQFLWLMWVWGLKFGWAALCRKSFLCKKYFYLCFINQFMRQILVTTTRCRSSKPSSDTSSNFDMLCLNKSLSNNFPLWRIEERWSYILFAYFRNSGSFEP